MRKKYTISEKVLARNRDLRAVNYYRNLAIYNDHRAGASLRDLQKKYMGNDGIPLSRSRIGEIVKQMEIYEAQNIQLNPAGKLSVGEITTELA